MFTAMRDPTKNHHLTGREIYTCVVSLAGNPDTNEQIKKVEHFCGFYSAMNQDVKKRAIYQQLIGHLPPASVNEAKELALSERPLTGRELGDVAQRQNREIAAYRAAVNAWRGNADSAMVLNQRCYAADPLWQQERQNGHDANKSDAVADVSFYQAIARCDSVTYIASISSAEQESMELIKVTLTTEDKIAAVVARLTATLGRSPMPSEIDTVVAGFGILRT